MVRSFVIAVVMTAVLAGVGFVIAPKPRAGAAVTLGRSEPIALSDDGDAAEAAAGDTEEDAGPNSSQVPANGKRIFYQWTDERGSVRFARSLDEVPPAWRDKVGQVEVDASAFQVKSARRTQAPARRAFGASAAEPGRRRDWHEITVYTAPWCGWCRKTLAFLDERGLEYVNKDVEADEEWAEELHEKSGSGSIPFVEIDGTAIRGYNPQKMTALLK